MILGGIIPRPVYYFDAEGAGALPAYFPEEC
jgi:hypothetical protein